MGLDAVVYKNPYEVQSLYGSEIVEIDESTGEAYQKDETYPRLPESAFEAVSVRLGNISEIADLRKCIFGLPDANNYTKIRTILAPESGSGTIIPRNDFEELKAEISLLLKKEDPHLEIFGESLSKLIRAGETERNPIVLV